MGTDEKKFLAEIRRERDAIARGVRPSKELREHIDNIIKHPGIEIGAPELERLYAYLLGYRQALADAGIEDGFFDGFQDFVQQQYGGRAVGTDESWATLMRERSASDAAGFEEFNRLWSLFVASDSRQPPTTRG